MDKKLICIVAATALCFLAGPASHACAGVIGHWSFNEGAGVVAADSSGHENHGTIVGAQWVASGWDGTGFALDFDGKGSNRVSLGPLEIIGGGMTLACWFKADTLDTPGSDPPMISKAFGTNSPEHIWMLSSGRSGTEKRLRFRLKTAPGDTTSELMAPTAGKIGVNEWIHAIATWDGTTMRLYKDGVEVGSVAKSGTAVATSPISTAAIGNQPDTGGDRPFDGLMDEVVIANRALTASEAAALAKGVVPNWSIATGPDPADGAVDVTSPLFQWTAGETAVFHNVYLGTMAELTEAELVASLQPLAMYFHLQPLQPGTTYYWRVDEVEADLTTVHTGDVWSFSTPALVVIDPNLAGWWTFDDGEGTTAIDISGHERHGTLNGSPQWVEGALGKALDFEFDNTQDCVVVPPFDVVAGGITLSAWIKPESFAQADGRIIDKGTDVAAANDAWWMLSTVASSGQSRLRFRLKTNENATTATQAATSGNIVVGEWCHAAAVWDGTSMILYQDGIEVGRMAKGGTAVAANPEAKVYIGNQLGGTQRRPWDGLIDDVRIYERALPELEVNDLAGN
jgi:hypothetical protein